MKVTALAGGVGGAKLADGLARVLEPGKLTVIVNTGDDFYHLGLMICPDIDTVCYTLAGLANNETGWGREEESWRVLSEITRLGGPSWFHLGDLDLAVHLERTHLKNSGMSLHEITRLFSESWGISSTILPMSDQLVATWVDTVEMGWLPFQEYFVREKCLPQVKGFEFRGIQNASPAPGVLQAILDADHIIICPSNPWVSIGPILALPGIKEALVNKACMAVSPLIGGKTVKGPAAKMYQELGIEPNNLAILRHYEGFLRTLIIDHSDTDDAQAIRQSGVTPFVTNTLMKKVADRVTLAKEIITWLQSTPEKEKP